MAITDYFTGTTNGSRPEPTTVTGVRAISGTTLQCNALTGWEAVQPVHFVTYKIDANGDKIAGSQCDWKGIVSGTTITQLTLKAGTDVGNAIGDVVVCMPTAAWAEDLVAGITVQHKQDGTHANTITTDTINENTAANGVTIDSLNIKDGKLNTNNSVVTANITDANVTNAKLSTTAGQLGGAWTTWAVAPTGFSGTPSSTGRYMQVGKTVFAYVDINGTSNATNFGFTLPVACKSTVDYAPRVMNAGTILTNPGLMEITTGTTTAAVFQDQTGAAFSGAGTKRLYAFSFTYEAA